MRTALTGLLLAFALAPLAGCGGGAEKGPAVPPTKVFSPPPTNEVKDI